jgi:hypothetical protein
LPLHLTWESFPVDGLAYDTNATQQAIDRVEDAGNRSAFEFHSDQHLKAYAWAADRTTPPPKFIDNQTGGTSAGRSRRTGYSFS